MTGLIDLIGLMIFTAIVVLVARLVFAVYNETKG